MRRYLFILCALLCLPLSALAQDGGSPLFKDAPFSFYSSSNARFHVLIPPDWANQSTADYALFVNAELGAELSARAVPTPQTVEGLLLAVRQAAADAQPSGEPIRINLTSGEWLSQMFTANDGRAITAFAHSDSEQTVTLIYTTTDGARPLIVPSEDLNAGIAAARAVYNQAAPDSAALPDEPSESDFITTASGNVWTRHTYTTAAGAVSLLARQAGLVVYAVIEPGAEVNLEHTIIYTALLDFFMTPETTGYLWLGLGVTALIGLVWVASMILRTANLKRDLRTLEQVANT